MEWESLHGSNKSKNEYLLVVSFKTTWLPSLIVINIK